MKPTGEPGVRRSSLGPGLCGFLAWFGTACVVGPIVVNQAGHAVGLLVWASLGALILPLSSVAVVVNRRRVVKYASGIAWLARHAPPLRRLERLLRQTYELADLEEVRVDRDLVLRRRDGAEHRLYMNSAAEEVEALAATIRSFLAPPPRLEGAPPVVDVPLAIHGERAVVVRCAYCHDDLVPVDLPTACSACHTPHHEECLSIHGGCAVRGCPRGRDRAPDSPS